MKEASKSVLSFGATAQSRSWGGASQKLRATMSSANVTDDASSATRASGVRGAASGERTSRPPELRRSRSRTPTLRLNRGMTRSAYSSCRVHRLSSTPPATHQTNL